VIAGARAGIDLELKAFERPDRFAVDGDGAVGADRDWQRGVPLPRIAIGGSIALSVLMIPIVVRSTEEMLKLVPDELREGAYALGVPKWRMITKVVLPTALGGIITGATLAVARVAGETAPLLLIAGTLRSINTNPFDGAMQTLPVLIFSEATKGGAKPEYLAAQIERAWGAALVLIIIVMLLNLLARVPQDGSLRPMIRPSDPTHQGA
jgi:phosphate transport system permease protein